VIVAFARSIHQRESATNDNDDHDKYGQQWAVHWNLPAAARTTVTVTRAYKPYPRTDIRSPRRTTRFSHAYPTDAQTIPVR
jgi:hypothetical protein